MCHLCNKKSSHSSWVRRPQMLVVGANRWGKKSNGTIQQQQPIKLVKISPKGTTSPRQDLYSLFLLLPKPCSRITCYRHNDTWLAAPRHVNIPLHFGCFLSIAMQCCIAVCSPCFVSSTTAGLGGPQSGSTMFQHGVVCVSCRCS